MCEGEWNSFPRQDQLEKEAVQTCAQRQQCNATILQVIDNYFTIKFDIRTAAEQSPGRIDDCSSILSISSGSRGGSESSIG